MAVAFPMTEPSLQLIPFSPAPAPDRWARIVRAMALRKFAIGKRDEVYVPRVLDSVTNCLRDPALVVNVDRYRDGFRGLGLAIRTDEGGGNARTAPEIIEDLIYGGLLHGDYDRHERTKVRPNMTHDLALAVHWRRGALRPGASRRHTQKHRREDPDGPQGSMNTGETKIFVAARVRSCHSAAIRATHLPDCQHWGMTVSARRCIFCDGVGLTAEHVLPKWIQTVIEVTEDLAGTTISPSGEGSTYRIDMSPLERRARVVCGACNSGWMAELEARAKPLLSRMIDDSRDQVLFSSADQELLAFWAVKTAITVQSVAPKHRRMSSRRLRRRVFKDRRPPVGTVVWIGRHSVPSLQVLVHVEPVPLLHAGLLPELDPWGRPMHMAFTCTLVIGALFIHILLFEAAAVQPDPSLTHPKTLCIWPNQPPSAWPPPAAMTELEVWEVAGIVPRDVPGLQAFLERTPPPPAEPDR